MSDIFRFHNQLVNASFVLNVTSYCIVMHRDIYLQITMASYVEIVLSVVAEGKFLNVKYDNECKLFKLNTQNIYAVLYLYQKSKYNGINSV